MFEHTLPSPDLGRRQRGKQQTSSLARAKPDLEILPFRLALVLLWTDGHQDGDDPGVACAARHHGERKRRSDELRSLARLRRWGGCGVKRVSGASTRRAELEVVGYYRCRVSAELGRREVPSSKYLAGSRSAENRRWSGSGGWCRGQSSVELRRVGPYGHSGMGAGAKRSLSTLPRVRRRPLAGASQAVGAVLQGYLVCHRLG